MIDSEATTPKESGGDSALSIDAKDERLRRNLGKLKRVAVAFSGGVDSTLLLKVAAGVLGADHVLAVTAGTASISSAELEQTRVLAAGMNVEQLIVDPGEFANEQYLSNPTNRCYYCKSALYDTMRGIVAERGIDWIASGANLDDGGDFRPGLAAAREQGVVAPLADAGLTKADVRCLSARLGLPTADKPASPCLSSRIPYGERVTPRKLAMIEDGERILHELGIAVCRVRHHGELARIEVPTEFFGVLTQGATSARIDREFRALGFQYVTLDLRGFRSGSLNEVVPLSVLGMEA